MAWPLRAASEERAELRGETEITLNLNAPGHVQKLRVLAPRQHRAPKHGGSSEHHLGRLAATPGDQERPVVHLDAKQTASQQAVQAAEDALHQVQEEL